MIKLIVLLVSLILGILTSLLFDFANPYLYVLVAAGFFVAYIILTVSLFFLSAVIIDIPINTKKKPEKYNGRYQKIFEKYVWCALSLFGVKLKAKGIEMVPTDTNFLLVGNHISNLDPMVTNIYFKDYPFIFASKESLFKVPFFGKMIHKIGYLKLNREDVRKDLKELERGLTWLKAGDCSLAVYPEGTRNKTGETTLLPFKDTCFKFAKNLQKPIVVSAIYGTKEVNNHLLTKRHVVYYEVIKTLYYDDYKDMTPSEISDQVYKMIEERVLEFQGK